MLMPVRPLPARIFYNAGYGASGKAGAFLPVKDRPGYLDISVGHQLAALAREAHEKICAYSHATRGNVDVQLEVEGT